MRSNRNINILEHIRDYCAEINHTMDTFGRDYEIFASNSYGKIDNETLWETLISDIPELNDYCCQIIEQECNKGSQLEI